MTGEGLAKADDLKCQIGISSYFIPVPAPSYLACLPAGLTAVRQAGLTPEVRW